LPGQREDQSDMQTKLEMIRLCFGIETWSGEGFNKSDFLTFWKSEGMGVSNFLTKLIANGMQIR